MEGDGEAEAVLLSAEAIRRQLCECANPGEAVEALQQAHGAGLGDCGAVLALLETLGVQRFELYKGLFHALKSALQGQLSRAPREVKKKILADTLPFLKLPVLEEVPLHILKDLPEVPPEVLDTLRIMDSAILEKLPRHTLQRIWEQFPSTFIAHTDPIIERYARDHASITWSEEMHPFVNFPPPLKRRRNSAPLQELIRAVGSSRKLYKYLSDHVREAFKNTADPRFCALRADLLMGLHDISALSVLATEPCHDFAWHLDAYVKTTSERMSRNEMNIGTADLQKSATMELEKVIAGNFKPNAPYVFEMESEAEATAKNLASQDGLNVSSNGAIEKIPSVRQIKHRVMNDVLKRIKQFDKNKTFWLPVIQSFPQIEAAYLAKISEPMDLATIEDRIRKDEYGSLDDMRRDLYLIADNARTFNGPKHQITRTADNIMKIKADQVLNKAAITLENELNERRMREIQEERRKQRELEREERERLAKLKKTPEEEKREQEEEERKKRLKEDLERRKEQVQTLREIEDKTKLSRAISDAAMILASGPAMNALTNVFWFMLREDVLRREILPRDSTMLQNVSWMIQIGGSAHDLVRAALKTTYVSPQRLDAVTETEVLPAYALMLLDSTENQLRQKKKGDSQKVPRIDPKLKDWASGKFVARATLLNFFCERVRRKDVEFGKRLLEVIKELGSIATDYPGFLHSLVTSFFFASKDRGKNLPGSENDSSMPADFLAECVTCLFLPAVLRTSQSATFDPVKISRQHMHLTRLLSLDSSIEILTQTQLQKFTRAAILSLAGTPASKDPVEILDSPELKDVINERYSADTFERARRQYERIFQKSANIRLQCGLPPLMGIHAGKSGVTPSPSPSPFVSPSPSPSPYVASPYGTPSVASPGGGAVKRPVDQNDPDGEKRMKLV